jgi:hypothetical protein
MGRSRRWEGTARRRLWPNVTCLAEYGAALRPTVAILQRHNHPMDREHHASDLLSPSHHNAG